MHCCWRYCWRLATTTAAAITTATAVTTTVGCSRGSALLLEGQAPTLAATLNEVTGGMVFALSLGLHDVPLTPQQRKGSSVTFDKYSIAIGDMVLVTDEAAEQLTKLGNQWNEVSYELGGDDDEEGSVDGDGDAMEVDSPAKKSKSEGKAKKERGGGSSSSIHDDAPLEGRLRKRGNDPEVSSCSSSIHCYVLHCVVASYSGIILPVLH
eukprot:14942-Heterococcus_DN1.PRE.4